MDLHIDWQELLSAFVRLPVLWVLLAGMAFGTALTQLLKSTYLAFLGASVLTAEVSRHRYEISVKWLSALSTYAFTLLLWHAMFRHSGPGRSSMRRVGHLIPAGIRDIEAQSLGSDSLA